MYTYKVITVKSAPGRFPGHTVFQPRNGSFQNCLKVLRLILGQDATVKQAVDAGYRIVRAS